MLILGNKRFVQVAFNNEAELERVVTDRYEDIFGPSSLFLPKTLIRTRDGFGTIPDGVVIDLGSKQWFMIEAELASHSVWNHIAPQIAKQITASSQRASKQILIDLAVETTRGDEAALEKFDAQGVEEIDIRAYLDEILAQDPVIGIPIDEIPDDLKEWASILRYKVNLWVVRKLVNIDSQSEIIFEIPEEFQPTWNISADHGGASQAVSNQEASLPGLLKIGLVAAGEHVTMSYKRRGGERHSFEGILEGNGTITVPSLHTTFPSLSSAAWNCMKSVGSPRPTVNGWDAWKTLDGRTLSEVRTSSQSATDTASGEAEAD